MVKQLFRVLGLFLALTSMQQAWAAVIATVPFEYGTRSAWQEAIEAESASVTKSGSFSVFNVGAALWNKGVWLFSTGSYIETAFTNAADTLIVQFESDTNDGVAEFLVDSVSVGTVDTYNKGWFGVEISGLTLATHTLRVRAAGSATGGGNDDLAIDVLGAKVSVDQSTPEPGTLALLGLGIAGLAATRRRKQ